MENYIGIRRCEQQQQTMAKAKQSEKYKKQYIPSGFRMCFLAFLVRALSVRHKKHTSDVRTGRPWLRFNNSSASEDGFPCMRVACAIDPESSSSDLIVGGEESAEPLTPSDCPP